MDVFAHSRSYSPPDSRKYRCVARNLIYLEEKKDAARARYFDRAQITGASFSRYWRMSRRAPDLVGETRRITANFRYLWDHMGPPYRPGRFNTAQFPALYTGRDAATAKAERFNYIEDGSKDFDFVVYSMTATGEVADLRPFTDSGAFDMPHEHGRCWNLAERIRARRDGVAWYSLRYEGGSCCAFFTCEGMEAVQIEEEDTFTL